MDCDTTTENPPTATLAGILKFKTKYHSKFLNRFWARHQHQQQNPTQGTCYARLNPSHQNSVTEIESQNYGKSVLPADAIQLQCLDVGSLLKMNERRDYKRLQCDSLTEGTLSFAGSSLDLEWEHEYDAVERCESREEPPNSWFQSEEESSSSSSEGNGRSIELLQLSSPTHKLNRQNNNCPPVTTKRWHSRHRRQGRARSQTDTNRCTSATKEDESENKRKPKTRCSHTSTPDSLEWEEDDQKFKSEDDSLDHETVELLNEIEWLKNQALIETGDAQWTSQRGES